MIKRLFSISLIAAGIGSYSPTAVFSAVSSDEAKTLGTTLTLVGAVKAGNAAGSIPEYTGVPVKPPASYDPSDPGQHPSPFADEKPLFSITAQNYSNYADKLGPAVDIFKRFPNYRMDIYPSHRSIVYPKYFQERTAKNASACSSTSDELSLKGCYGGFPFPIPKTGKEAMWNHLFQFQTDQDSGGISEATVVPANGSPVLQALVRATNSNPFFKPDFSGTFKPSDIFWRIRTQDIGPARKAGGGTLLLDAVDQINFGRRAFSYIPGQRRVKLAPDLSYDTPTPYTGGSSTMDDAMGGFMGALDRFEFTLVGRKEMYIPYNMFALSDRNSCPMEKLTATKNFPNPECVRFELHRVWHVKAKLKAGFRHIYKTREFFWDEDAPAAGMAFAYDATGALYRATWSISFPYYEAPGGVGGMFGNAQLGSDVITGNWYVIGGGNCREKNCGWTVTPAKGETFWSPEAMASEGIR